MVGPLQLKGGMSVERYSDEAMRILDDLHTERLDYYSEYLPLIDAAQRLGAYESTGMEPDDLERSFNEDALLKMTGNLLGIAPDRLRELAQADREGRCVVLKFAPGSKVYRVWFNPRDGKFFITEHIMKSKEMCLEAELWNDAYKTREEAEKALEEMEKTRNG